MLTTCKSLSNFCVSALGVEVTSTLGVEVTANEAELRENKLLLEEFLTVHETSKIALATAEHSQIRDSDEIARLQNRLGQEEETITKEKARSEVLQQKLHESQDTMESLKDENLSLAQHLHACETKSEEFRVDRQSLVVTIELQQHEIDELQASEAENTRKIQEYTTQLREQNDTATRYRTQMDQAAAANEELEQSRLKLEKTTQKDIASYKAREQQASVAIQKLKVKRASLEIQLEALQARSTRALDVHILRAEKHRTTIAQLQKKYNTLDTELKSRQKKNCLVESESYTMRQELSQTMDLLAEIQQNLKSESEAQAMQVLRQEELIAAMHATALDPIAQALELTLRTVETANTVASQQKAEFAVKTENERIVRQRVVLLEAECDVLQQQMHAISLDVQKKLELVQTKSEKELALKTQQIGILQQIQHLDTKREQTLAEQHKCRQKILAQEAQYRQQSFVIMPNVCNMTLATLVLTPCRTSNMQEISPFQQILLNTKDSHIHVKLNYQVLSMSYTFSIMKKYI